MGKNVPQLRFPEFTAEWEEKTLGELGKFRKGKLVSSSNVTDSGVPAMMYGDIYVKYNIDFDSVDYRVSEEMAENCVKIHKGDLLFTCSGETDIDIAKCVCYTGSDEVCIGGDILALTPDKDNSLFIAQHQNTYKTAVQKARVSQGHSVVHIYEQQLSELTIHLPSLEEQEKISKFLSAYDKAMRNQEEKISALRERKHGLLKKIFTQQVRFKDKDGNDYPAWEEKKLKDIFEIKAGGDIDRANSSDTYSEEYPYAVYANSLEKNGLYGYANYYKIEGDTLTVTGRGDVGVAVARHEKFVPIVRLLVCIPKGKDNVDFFAECINNTKIFIESTGVPQLTSPQLGSIIVKVPSIEEQDKIAEVLSAFDKKIEIEQEILSNMQEFKRGLLQKMFI